jgi:hypothetical protein
MPRTLTKSSKPLPVQQMLEKIDLRARIIEVHYLQQSIAREAALRAEHPDLWRRAEDARLARNASQAGLNRALRAAGCKPVETELSLKQKMKKLRQLEARNRAEIASFRTGK